MELGYEIAASRRGRGLATAATHAMLVEAFGDQRVTTVIAHTLAEPNASTRVLEKAGFAYDREVHADDEVTWRFAIVRSGWGRRGVSDRA